MENQSLESLIADPMNPRLISADAFAELRKLLYEYGDLSAVVKNQRTGQIVGGHKRTEAFKLANENKGITITQRFEPATRTGTIAIGYIVADGEPHPFRLVDWDPVRQHAANVAANKAAELAKWDPDKLAEINEELRLYDLEHDTDYLHLTAQTDEELALLNAGPEDEPQKPSDGKERFNVRFTESEYETVMSAIQLMKHERNLQMYENDDKDAVAIYLLARDYLDAASHNTESLPEPPTDQAFDA